MKISAKVRAEAIEAYMHVAAARQRGRQMFTHEVTVRDETRRLMSAVWVAARGDDYGRPGVLGAHDYAAAASLLDAGWSP